MGKVQILCTSIHTLNFKIRKIKLLEKVASWKIIYCLFNKIAIQCIILQLTSFHGFFQSSDNPLCLMQSDKGITGNV